MRFTSIIVMTTAVATALVSSLTSALCYQPTAQSKNATLSILTHNVYFMRPSFSKWGQVERAGLISNSNYIKNHDVVVLQECFYGTACDALRSGLLSQYRYQTPTVGTASNWDSTSGSYSMFIPENGGVTILSKWPIKQQHQFIYRNRCGADWLALKGFAYVILDYKGTNLHVFGTHTQSDDDTCLMGQAEQYRGFNMNQMRQFIDSRNIPANELVIMAGDFNIMKGSEEFSDLISRLGAVQPGKYEGWRWTWDSLDNTIANSNYPNTRMVPPQYIDFVFTDAKHSSGVRSSVQTSRRVKSSPYVLKGIAYNDYSDHYPVITEIQVDL